MKKKLMTQAITDELRGNSVFFPGKETKPSKPVPPAVPRPEPRPVPPKPTTLIPKVKRPIRQRQPFDIYEDQYEKLKSIAEKEKGFENGRGMSKMVRDALDTYLKENE